MQEISRLEAVDQCVLRVLKDREIPGLSLSLLEAGVPVLTKGYGSANLEWEIGAGPETVYEIASISKPITSLGVLSLVDEGKLTLDDEIGGYLPDLPDAWCPATVRQLMDHRSGIKNYNEAEGFWDAVDLRRSTEEIVRLRAATPLANAPGENFEYSNTGYALLGFLIEKCSGQPYEAFVTERIFDPAGMRNTRLMDYLHIVPRRAEGYTKVDNEWRHAKRFSAESMYAGGGLISTAADLGRLETAFHQGKLLSRELLQRLWLPSTRQPTPVEAEAKFINHLGWRQSQVNGQRAIWHSGGLYGFSGIFMRFVETGLTVIALWNCGGGGNKEEIAVAVATAWRGD